MKTKEQYIAEGKSIAKMLKVICILAFGSIPLFTGFWLYLPKVTVGMLLYNILMFGSIGAIMLTLRWFVIRKITRLEYRHE